MKGRAVDELSGTHAARRARLRQRLESDALLVTRAVNVRYLTGFTGSAGVLLLSPGAEVLATDGRYAQQARGEVGELEVVVTRGDNWLDERLEAGTRLGLESHDLSWERVEALRALLGAVELVPVARAVETLREIKDDAELAAIRHACEITSDAFAALLDWVRPGMTEREIALRLETGQRAGGADDRAFESIVASGPNSARPHHRPTDRVVERGDLLKVDFGALVDGYHSDMTRTVAIGEPDAELRRIYEVVAAAQRSGREAVTDGASAADVDRACRDIVAEAGLADRFVHGTGHGIGLEVHEEPILRSGATATLRARMVVTVEPGVYVPGLGGVRIEDTVAVAADGGDVLTSAPRSLTVL